MADVERNWFCRALEQPDLPAIFWTDKARHVDWAPLDGAEWGANLAVWQAEREQSRLMAAAHSLGDIGVATRSSQRAEFSLRWIYSHMVEECAVTTGTPI